LFEETLFQNASDGTPFVKMLQSKKIIPGIKVRFCLSVCLCRALLRCRASNQIDFLVGAPIVGSLCGLVVELKLACQLKLLPACPPGACRLTRAWCLCQALTARLRRRALMTSTSGAWPSGGDVGGLLLGCSVRSGWVAAWLLELKAGWVIALSLAILLQMH
jgi:hypothetical protein